MSKERIKHFFGDMVDINNLPPRRPDEESDIERLLQQANNEMYLLTSRTKKQKLSKRQKKQIDILLREYEVDPNIGLYLD